MGEETREREHLAQDAAEDLELRNESADGVKGGEITQDVTVNKAKTSDKNTEFLNAYIRG
jgi:hypothetical protein